MICRVCRSLEVILLPTLLYVQDTVGVQDKPRVCQLPLVRTFQLARGRQREPFESDCQGHLKYD